jgi:hypothetical protein
MGSSFGALYVLELRKAIQRGPELLRLWEERQNEAIEKLTEEVGRVTNAAANRENFTALQSLRRELLQRRLFWMTRRFSTDTLVDESLRRHVEVLFNGDSRFFWLSVTGTLQLMTFPIPPRIIFTIVHQLISAFLGYRGVVQNELEILGTDPMRLIGAGIACLLVSVLSFAAYSQKPAVWLPCVMMSAVFAINMFLSWGIQCECDIVVL